jgi:quinoprotein glucose dehydrogenase
MPNLKLLVQTFGERLTTCGGWVTLIMALTILLLALPLTALGLRLITLGGSWYYAIAGAVFTAAAMQILRERRIGYWLYVYAFVGTILWSFWEVGADPWGLLPRLLTFTVIQLVFWMIWRWVDNRLMPVRSRLNWWNGIAGAMAAIVAAVVFSLLFVRGPIHSAEIADVISVGRPNSGPPNTERASGMADGDWPNYGRGPGGERFSPLSDITPENVKGLKRAWVYHTGALGPTFEGTPLIVRGKLVVCISNAQVVALDPVTGKESWRFNPAADLSHGASLACRGVAYDKTRKPAGPCVHRILFATVTARMYALDLETGERCTDFGTNGEIDLTAGMGLVKPGFYYVTSPPAIVRGKAVVGGLVWDNVERGEPSGVVRAFDTTTGVLSWAFDVGRLDRTTLPPPGEHYTRGTPNVWAPISADPQLGLVYLPTGNETPDFFGGDRQEASEKFASSIIAVDVETGRLRWHFQTVHHDIWDMDIPAQPVLIDIPETPGAKPTPAVLVATKPGDLFLFDRRDGRPLTHIEERPAPQGAVAGDFTSGTQPYSDLPSLAPPRLTEAKMWGVTPLDQLECRIAFRRHRYDGMFTPPSIEGSIVYPSSLGVFEWGSISTNPARGMLFANTSWMPLINTLIPRAPPVPAVPGTSIQSILDNFLKALAEPSHRFERWVLRLLGVNIAPPQPNYGGPMLGTPYASLEFPFSSSPGIPCHQPPWGHMSAIDLISREIVWRNPLGGIRLGLFGTPLGIHLKIGLPNLGGSVVTAGGVVFVAASMDRTFRALDAATGEELWRDYLPAGGNATPTIYRGANGKQYVVLAAGGHYLLEPIVGDSLIAYTLP